MTSMKSTIKIMQKATAVLVKKVRNFLGASTPLRFRNVFHVQHYNKEGQLLREFDALNGLVDEGRNKLLDVMFHGVAAIGTWYIGLVDDAGYTAYDDADTLASHTGWNEFTSYTGSRPAWTEGAAASGSITNATPVDIAITGSGDVRGLFLASVASGTSGTLWATADFAGGTLTVSNGDTIRVTYTVSVP